MMSRPLPCGMPSTMSISTISASSRSASRCASVAPTLPPPTTVTFLFMGSPVLVWLLERAQEPDLAGVVGVVGRDAVQHLAEREPALADGAHGPLQVRVLQERDRGDQHAMGRAQALDRLREAESRRGPVLAQPLGRPAAT